MSKTYDEIKQMKVNAVAYDPTVFDSTRSVLEQLEIIKEYISEFPTGFVVWSVPRGSWVQYARISDLTPVGPVIEGRMPQIGDIGIFLNGEIYEIVGFYQDAVEFKVTFLADLRGPKGDSIKGDPGKGFNDLKSIDFTYGQPYTTFSTDEGMIISGGGRAVLNDYTTFEFATEIEVPIVPGEGITMDANEENEAVVISLDAEVSSDLARAIKEPIAAVSADSVPVVKPNRDVDFVPVSSLGGSSVSLFSTSLYQNTLNGYYYLYPPKEAGIKKIEITSIRYSMYTMGGEEPKVETFSSPVVIYENGSFVQSFSLYVNYDNKDFAYEDYANGYWIQDFAGYSGIGPSTAQFTFKVYF